MNQIARDVLRRAGAQTVEQLENRWLLSSSTLIAVAPLGGSANALADRGVVAQYQHRAAGAATTRSHHRHHAHKTTTTTTTTTTTGTPSLQSAAAPAADVSAAPAPAPAIGVKFSGGGNGGSPAIPLAVTDSAGIVAQTHYNNFNGASGAGALLDSNGNASGASLNFTGGGNYSAAAGTPTFGDANEKLNDGFMYGTSDLKVANVPYSHFDVYIYELNDGANRTQITTNKNTNAAVYGNSATPNDSGHIDGNSSTPYVYTQTTSTDSANPTANGDYVLFAGQTPDGTGQFEFTTTSPGNNGYLNGFQIVANPWQGDPLPAPTGVTTQPGNGSIALSWTASKNAFSYTVYRNGVAVATGLTGTSYTDTGLTNGTTYSYTVTADNSVKLDSSGNPLGTPVNQSSSQSTAVNGTPAVVAPAAPTGVAASSNATTVTVTWNAANFATSYTIKRGTTVANATQIATGVTGTTFTEPKSNLTAGQSYVYIVDAVNTAGSSPDSAPSVALSTGDGWTASYYRDQKAGSGDVNNPTVTAVPTGYDFQRIEATINESGNTTTPPVGVPTYFNTDNPAPNNGDDFSARWDGYIVPQYSEQYTLYPTTDDGSQVFIEDPSSPGTFINLDKANNIAYGTPPVPMTLAYGRGATEDTLPVVKADGTPIVFTAGQKYHVVVEFAQGGGGWESDFKWSSASQAKAIIPQSQVYAAVPTKVTGPSTDNVTPPSPTSSPTAIGNNQSVALKWAPTAADSYNIYRSTTPGGEGATPYKTGVTGNTYNDTGLTNGTTYYYQISAVTIQGEGALSNEVSAAATPQPPVAPTNVLTNASVSTAGAAKVTVSWDSIPFTDSYIVQRAFESSPGSGTPGTFTTVTGGGAVTGTSFTDTDPSLALGKVVYYRVIGHNNLATNDPNGTGVGNSPPSATVQAITLVQGGLSHIYQPTWWNAVNGNTNSYLAPAKGVNLTPGANLLLATVNSNGGDGTVAPVTGINGNTFSVVVTGKIHITTTGDYTFPSQTDDDGYTYVAGTLVTADPGGHGTETPIDGNVNGAGQTQILRSIHLQGGQDYNFQLFETNTGGGWGYQLHYKGPDSNNTDVVIPNSALKVVTGAPAAATGLTASPSLNADGDTYNVQVTFNDNATNELKYVLQRSTSPTFAAGTVFTVATEGVVDNGPTDSTTGAPSVPQVTITDQTAPASSTLYYRLVALNYDGSTTSSIITATTTAPSPSQGAEGHYYNNQWWQSSDQSTTGQHSTGPNSQPSAAGGGAVALTGDVNSFVSTVDRDQNNGDAPDPSLPNSNFSTVFTGKFTITQAGNYTFPTSTDDDSYLYVDGVLVSSDPGGHGTRPAPNQTTVNLTAGAHDFVFYQSQGGGGWGYHLLYNGPDTNNAPIVIPTSALSTQEDAPTAAGFTATSPAGNAVTLSWTNSKGAVRYYIQKSAKAFNDPTLTDADITNLFAGTGSTSFTDNNVAPGQTWHYRMMAQNFDASSAFTADTPVTVSNTLPPPVVAAKQGDAGIDIVYNNPSAGNPNLNVTGWQVLRSTDGTNFTPVTVVAPGTLTYFDSTGPAGGFVVGQTYYYEIVAQGTPANSVPSNIVQVKYQTPVTVPNISHSSFGISTGLIANGSFESPRVGPNNFAYQSTATGGPQTVGGWVFNGAAGLLNGNGGAFTGPTNNQGVVGNQYAYVQTNATDPHNDATNGNYIQQSVTVATAGSYTLGLWDAARNGQAPTYNVVLDYTGPGTGTILYSGAPTSRNFTQETIPAFNLTAGAHTITILSTNTTGDNSAYFDAIRLLPTASFTPLTPPADLQVNGSVILGTDDNKLRLTDGNGNESGSVYAKVATKISDGFTTSFDFQLPTQGADGFAFVLQEADPTQVGGGGGGFGYTGIPGKSVEVFFNQYNNVTQTGVGQNGANGTAIDMSGALGGNVFHPASGSTDVFTVTLKYDATAKTVTETVKDKTTNATYTNTYNIDLAAALGDNYAYVGFAGATGGVASTQDILNWNFAPAAPATPPNLTSTLFKSGKSTSTTQRSEIRNITLTFDHAVTLASGAVTMVRLNSGGSGTNDNSPPTDVSAALGTPTTADGGLTWIVPVLSSTAFSDATGSLTDGIYTVSINAAKVTDASNNTLAGGNQTINFHRLFGDINGDKTLNNTDYFQFKNAFNSNVGDAKYNPDFDVDNINGINNTDYFQFKNRFNKTFTYA